MMTEPTSPSQMDNRVLAARDGNTITPNNNSNRKPIKRKKSSFGSIKKKSKSFQVYKEAMLNEENRRVEMNEDEEVGTPQDDINISTAMAIVGPPSGMLRKLSSLQRKVESGKQQLELSKKKLFNSELNVKLARQELRQDRKVSNILIQKANNDAAIVMKEALDVKKESEAAVLLAKESNMVMKDECIRKIRNERQHFSSERKALSDKMDSECRGYEALIGHIRKLHISAENRLTSKFTKQLALQEDMLEKEKRNSKRAEEKFEMILNDHSKALHEEKMARREVVQKVMDENAALKSDIKDLCAMINEMSVEVNTANKEKNAALRKAVRNADKAASRYEKLKDIECRLARAVDNLAEESRNRYIVEKDWAAACRLEIKRERPIGRVGGSDKWTPEVVLLICELLVNGTAPAAIPPNIQTMYYRMNKGVELKELPSVSFARSCRVVLQNLNDMLAAYKLGTAEHWHQLFTDGTTRRQTTFLNLIIGVLDDDGLMDTVIASSCIFAEEDTSELQVDAIYNKVRYVGMPPAYCFIFDLDEELTCNACHYLD